MKDYIKIHMHLIDDGHEIDAKLLNKMEKEFLIIVEDLSHQMNIKCKPLAIPRKEGGFIDFFGFELSIEEAIGLYALGRDVIKPFIESLRTIITEVVSDKIKTDEESEELKKEKIRSEIELNNSTADKLKTEIDNLNKQNNTDSEIAELKVRMEELVKNNAVLLAEANRSKIAKSNFYSNAKKINNLIAISAQEVDEQLNPVGKKSKVPRKDFDRFIITEQQIESRYETGVLVPIVSAVIKNSRAYWRGLFDGVEKNFAMKDKTFKRMVIERRFSFENGSQLRCDIETKLKMTDSGEILEKGKSAYNVIEVITSDGEVLFVEN
jgi:hypothetical protein